MGDGLLVADSFRMRIESTTAEVRGFSRHVDRFTRDVMLAAGDSFSREDVLDLIDSFQRDAADAGNSFPRLELWQRADGSRHLTYRYRPLPELRGVVDLEPVRGLELSSPRVKGPNIEYLRNIGDEMGAEPLLCTEDGSVIEGATTSILWWDGDVPRIVENCERVTSVTERIVVDVLHEFGIDARAGQIGVSTLIHHEVWAMNALHGIRSVSRIGAAPCVPPNAARLKRVRAAYDGTWEPLSSGPTSSA